MLKKRTPAAWEGDSWNAELRNATKNTDLEFADLVEMPPTVRAAGGGHRAGGDWEFRTTFEGLSVRSAPERRGGGVELSGYGAVHNVLSADLGGFREMLAPGCFAPALANEDSDTLFLVDHDPSKLLGRRSAGTLQVWEDSHGLAFRDLLPDTELARSVSELVRRGDLNGCSFGFMVAARGDSWAYTGTQRIRTIQSLAGLSDVSVVACPAYPKTSVSLARPAMRANHFDGERLRLLEIARRS
ncbi:MAG TPA: HK97 family phage prohead protease [Pirellulales bacterium]|jgi:hypothetical protein|nr:HK97 family phage prohead protease [Pirellulales bacterium]